MNKNKLQIFANYFSNLNNLNNCSWIAGNKKSTETLVTDKNKLNNLGINELGIGTNCSEYYKYNKQKVSEHTNKQIELYENLTGMPIENLYFPKVCNIYGKHITDKLMIPPTAPRCGYYAYQIKKYISNLNIKKDNIVITEIGGGWGALAYIIKKIINCTYIIVDIPQSLINISYVLEKCGKKVIMENEISNLDETIKNKQYDYILITPNYIKNISNTDIVVSTACLPELPQTTIDFYINFIKTKCSSFAYIDYTNMCRGKYLEKKYIDFEVIHHDVTPINCYMFPYINKNYGKNDLVREIILDMRHQE